MFLDDFTDFVAKILPEKTNNILMGDFNLHISEDKDDPSDISAAIFMDTCEAMGLYQHVTFPTHKAGNTLDLILSEISNSIRVSTTNQGPFISDHRAVICTLMAKKERPKEMIVQLRKTKGITQEQWIHETNSDNITLSNKLDEVVSSLDQELKRVIDTLTPTKKCTLTLRTKRPWYDDELQTLKRRLRCHERKWLKYQLQSKWTAFKALRNKYTHLLKRKKHESIYNKINSCSNYCRKLYKLINNLTTKESSTQWPKHASKQSLVDGFSDYFEEKILLIRKRFTNISPYYPQCTAAPKLVKFAPMTQKQVLHIMNQLKSKSCELNTMPTHIFKQIAPSIAGLITKIINLSLEEGEFCRTWKTAVVHPLLKKIGLELIQQNYRPVSNLPFLSKVIERCMLLQLSHHCNEYHLQPDYQSAYRENYSCETAVLGISNDILWAMENQCITSLTAIDLSAAFHTVNHNILLAILNNKFGIEEKALKWFDSYLHPRSYKLVTEGTYSCEKNLTVSVPQGSCASAAIFNLFCSLLEEVVPKGLQLSGFADDHSIRNTFKAGNIKAKTEAKSKVESCMLNIKQWMDATHLKMNPNKTEFIYFRHPVQLRKCNETSINMAGDLIVRGNLIKYLGVWMDEGLTFKHHITKKCQMAMLNFLKIRSICQYLDQDTTEHLVLSLCMSDIDYSNSILYGLPDCSIRKLQCIQSMCAYLVLRRGKRDSISQCLSQLHWLPIKH